MFCFWRSARADDRESTEHQNNETNEDDKEKRRQLWYAKRDE